MAAYQDMIRETSTDYAPWYVVPADHKHVAWLVVSAAIIEALEKLKLEYPKVTGKALKELKACERALEAEKPGQRNRREKNKSGFIGGLSGVFAAPGGIDPHRHPIRQPDRAEKNCQRQDENKADGPPDPLHIGRVAHIMTDRRRAQPRRADARRRSRSAPTPKALRHSGVPCPTMTSMPTALKVGASLRCTCEHLVGCFVRASWKLEIAIEAEALFEFVAASCFDADFRSAQAV